MSRALSAAPVAEQAADPRPRRPGRDVSGRSPRPRWQRLFHVAIAVALMIVVAVGFWPSYFGPLLGGTLTRHWMFHLHAAVFGGWLVLLLAQASLAASGDLRMHRRVGSFGVAYAVLVLLFGLALTFVAPALHVRAGTWSFDEAAGFLVLPLVDMVLFAGFFGVAIACRGRPEVHKRLILAASVALAFPAVARMFDSPAALLLVWLSPLVAAVGFDLLTRRRPHPVNVVGIAILAAAYARVALMDSEAWLGIGRALLGPLV